MRQCKIIKKSRIDQLLELHRDDARNSEDIEPEYLEGCKFIQWDKACVQKKRPIGEDRYVYSLVEIPHGLIELRDGTVDLIPYTDIVFTDVDDGCIRIGDVFRNKDPYEGEGEYEVIELLPDYCRAKAINSIKHPGINGCVTHLDYTVLHESFVKVKKSDVTVTNDILELTPDNLVAVAVEYGFRMVNSNEKRIWFTKRHPKVDTSNPNAFTLNGEYVPYDEWDVEVFTDEYYLFVMDVHGTQLIHNVKLRSVDDFKWLLEICGV